LAGGRDDLEQLVRSGLTIVVGTDDVPSGAHAIHGVSIWDVALAPEGVTVATDDGSVVLANVDDGPARDASGALLGWRMWRIRHDRRGTALVSPVRDAPWRRGVLTATCGECGLAGMAGCTCGLYAFGRVFDALPEWLETEVLVLGQIRGWGHAVIHEQGFRCEHAQILRLLASTFTPQVRAALSTAYDCPVT
jgi:hypothetical protein